MQIDVKQIDPDFDLVARLKPSSVHVYRVRKNGKDYVLKAVSNIDDKGVQHLLTEMQVLALAREIEGTPSFAGFYGSVSSYTALLKEYVEGQTLYENPLDLRGTHLEPYLRDLVGQFHSRGIANLGLRKRNVVVSPDQSKASFIDLGTAVFRGSIPRDDFFRYKAMDSCNLEKHILD